MDIARVAEWYGLPSPTGVTFAGRGAVGRLWRLDAGGSRYAVKELSRTADEETIAFQVACARRAVAAGVPAPDSLPGRDGRYLLEGRVRVFEWVDGTGVDLGDPSLAARVGELLGRLHAGALPPVGDVDPWYESVPDPARWAPLVESASDEAWLGELAGNVALVQRLGELVTPAPRELLVTCHRDLHPDNVLQDATGNLIVLDWDDVGPATPGRELARALLDWYPTDLAAAGRVLTGYRAAGGPGWLTEPGVFGMAVACRLNFLYRQVTIALDPSTVDDDRRYAVREIDEGLAMLPTPDQLRGIMTL